MKNGDKFIVKLYGDLTRENIDSVINNICDSEKFNTSTFDLYKSESILDEYYSDSLAICVKVNDISSIEYGF